MESLSTVYSCRTSTSSGHQRSPWTTAWPIDLPLQTIPPCKDWKPQTKLLARSLVDWLHESGITLARTLVLTPLQETNRARNVVSLREVAQKIHLWFDPEIHDPDLPLLPLQCYVTDGSFCTHINDYFDILTSEEDLRAKSTGAAAIVFVSSARDREPLPHTVRITTSNPTEGMSAYAWELLAQLVALKLTQYHSHTVMGYSDCKATIDRINMALSTSLDQLGHTTAGILSTSAHVHSSTRLPRQIRYIAAHPERDVNRWNNPTILDRAIFLADAIAGESTTKYNQQFINHVSHTLTLEDILVELLPLKVWHMRHTSNIRMPILDLPWKYQHKHQLSQYLKHRDTYSPAPSVKWQSSAIDFAHCVHPIHTHYKGSYWKAARRTSILFDWTGHGYNQFKKSNIGQSPPLLNPHVPCKHCG